METITHLNQMENGHYQNKGVCGQENNCNAVYYRRTLPPVHHCITRDINNVSCAECADAYAEQNKTPEQHNLDAAFKIIAAKDAEIAQLENEVKLLREQLSKSSNQVFGLNVQNERLKRETLDLSIKLYKVKEEFRKYQNNIIDHVTKLIGKI